MGLKRIGMGSVGLAVALLANPQGSYARDSLPAGQTAIACDVLVAGGGLAGVATAYEALHAGKTVCLTELTDWVGGQISSQGTSALDETVVQRSQSIFPKGYLEFRNAILARIPQETPGNCWVSAVCFLPKMGNEILREMLERAEKQGKGKLLFFPNTVVKSLEVSPQTKGAKISKVRAIQHRTQPNTPPLNSEFLSQSWDDFYTETDSPRFAKTILEFTAPPSGQWIVVEATETGELLALADLPYRVGIDPLTYREPSSSSKTAYPYCTQAFTYTFAMESTAQPEPATPPPFYKQYEPFYSYDADRYAKNPALVFTYRRILSTDRQFKKSTAIYPGDISMQNWGGGNDYGPGNPVDNLIYTRQQLLDLGQLAPNGWKGGLRTSSLRGGEELAQGYFYWLVAGTTDSKLGPEAKKPWPNLRYLKGFDSPMGTAHGLSKFPYMREGRRLIGRDSYAYASGFTINETDVSAKDFRQPYYRDTLPDRAYRDLITSLAGLNTIDVITDKISLEEVKLRSRARLYPDSVGIGHYPIDFHPCMAEAPPEKPGNTERAGERQGAHTTHPYQIPLRAMIPPRIDNLLVAGKSIATSHIGAATYRVHSFEWSSGAAAGTTAAFALAQNILPYQLVENVPRTNLLLESLQKKLNENGNPTAFPGVSIFNQQ
ncbi:FAD-dependent oxidoreductase [Altericista sp. CCNU0014]|uniref:FAD-dependent oxidoreductase n=1 Tax=Altericista sp. CCNU0014 TaxID=3082949 RepID=UPI00384F9AAD